MKKNSNIKHNNIDTVITLAKLLEKVALYAKKIYNTIYSRTLPILTYRKLVEDTVLFKPEDPRVKCASAIRETTQEGYIKVSVVYMDENQNIIWDDNEGKEYSFAIVAKKIDSELQEMFGDKNIILFN